MTAIFPLNLYFEGANRKSVPFIALFSFLTPGLIGCHKPAATSTALYPFFSNTAGLFTGFFVYNFIVTFRWKL